MYKDYSISSEEYNEIFQAGIFNHLRRIVRGYYPVIVAEPDKEGYSEWYHIEWVDQRSAVEGKVSGLICPWELFLPRLKFFKV